MKSKDMGAIRYRPIGIIYSPFKEPKGTPIQPSGGRGAEGKVEVFPKYAAGLKRTFINWRHQKMVVDSKNIKGRNRHPFRQKKLVKRWSCQ